jgi:RimJ/RimL family protein N-acetyltransferase
MEADYFDHNFRFVHAAPSQKKLLHQWFEQKHIKEWMHGAGLQSTLKGLEKFFEGETDTIYWIGYEKNIPFAFLITSPAGKETITLDLFICDLNYLGKGLAVPMIEEFLISQFSHMKKVLIDPEVTNTRAVHVYQKVGFKIIGEFIASWHPVPHYQMELDLKDLKKTRWMGLVSNHEGMIYLIAEVRFNQIPQYVSRIAIGICNEVYRVGLNECEVIARLSPHDRFLMGSHDHIPQFKALGISVPDILAEDYSKNLIPFSYQVLSKIDGDDLGQIIETLSDQQLQNLAKEVANIFKKVRTIPASDKYGIIWGGGDNELSDTWTERMEIWVEESMQRGLSTGVMDDETAAIAKNLYRQYQPYFASIKPTTYYGDICSKNIMIHKGVFSGLVDLDGLTQGDYLEAVGRIKLSWYGTPHGDTYSTAIMNELGLTQEQRHFVTMYALLNQISWACENGIQFNQNTKAKVDQDKKRRDRSMIKKLASELGI